MKRREFLQATAAASLLSAFPGRHLVFADGSDEAECCDRTFASPAAAMTSAPETLVYVPAIFAGTNVDKPDYLATVDVDPSSKTYGQVIHRLAMPNVGDELHHFGWNACSSCHGDEHRGRRFIVLPGLASSRIHLVDTSDPRSPTLHHVVEPSEIFEKVGLSTPHTVHCLADGNIMISMLGTADRNAPGGFMLLDQEFQVKGHWSDDVGGMNFNYDYWYQPRHNVMVSSEWAAPSTVAQGFKLEDVQAGKYGRHIHFWDWEQRSINKSVDLGEGGLIPLEVRFHHNPDSTHGFVGAALSSNMWHWNQDDDGVWQTEKIISVETVDVDGWPFPVPGLITDLVLSLDDRWLYFSNWLHGDIRQYDVSDPAHPKLAGQIWLGGVIGHAADTGRKINGGPQMLQLSLDGKRLYVTNSLYSPWDNQFYPEMAQQGSYMMQIDCDSENGGLSINERFFVDFGKEPNGAARAHEMRFPNGDCTSDIWV